MKTLSLSSAVMVLAAGIAFGHGVEHQVVKPHEGAGPGAHTAQGHDTTAGDGGQTTNGSDGADSHAAHRPALEAGTRIEESGAVLDLPPGALVDQAGGATSLESVARGRIVIVDFVFTTCTTVCPVSSATLAAARQALGPRMEDEVVHLSISTDPVTDTPARLSAYAQPFLPLDGWHLLTGEKASVDAVLTAFDAYTADFRDHPQMVLVGDAASGRFYRMFGLPDPDMVIELVDRLAAARGDHS